MHLYRATLEKVPLFKDKPPQFITSLVTCLKLEYYSPGDIVVRQGEVGHEMFFVTEGRLEVSRQPATQPGSFMQALLSEHKIEEGGDELGS